MIGRHICLTGSCDFVIHKQFLEFRSVYGCVIGIVNKKNQTTAPQDVASLSFCSVLFDYNCFRQEACGFKIGHMSAAISWEIQINKPGGKG